MKDERGPGLDFTLFCVWQSSVRGCRFSVMFVYFVIKMCLNVRRFPPPSSRIYHLRYNQALHYCFSEEGWFFLIKTPALHFNFETGK